MFITGVGRWFDLFYFYIMSGIIKSELFLFERLNSCMFEILELLKIALKMERIELWRKFSYIFRDGELLSLNVIKAPIKKNNKYF